MSRLLHALFGPRYGLFQVIGFILGTRIVADGDFVGATAVIVVFTLIGIAGELHAKREAAEG